MVKPAVWLHTDGLGGHEVVPNDKGMVKFLAGSKNGGDGDFGMLMTLQSQGGLHCR
jgi:hypothetical protein